MATIERTLDRWPLETGLAGTSRWAAIARASIDWAAQRHIALRDAVVLVPFAQLLPHARQAFARAGGWQPRIETTQTLAAALGPSVPGVAGQLAFDPTLDALNAAALLRERPEGAAWSRRDRQGFDHAVRALVATAQALAQAAFARAPVERADFWAAAREALAAPAGPGGTERVLARIALEWAALAPAPATDRLFALDAVAGWIAVRAGGAQPLVDALLGGSIVPALVIDADPPADDPFGSVAPRIAARIAATPSASKLATQVAPVFGRCDGFEHEALATAAQVLEHLRRGEQPVALIAQDRVLVRRVRALLEREGVALLDETGWKLSTTRAAARVMSLLRAARPEAGTDALFDWLKTGTTWTRGDDERALAELERVCRRRSVSRIASLEQIELTPRASRLREAAIEVLKSFAEIRRQPLGAWLVALAQALARCGSLVALQADGAGRQLLVALRMGTDASADTWGQGSGAFVMSLSDFQAWVDATLEEATFRPPAPSGGFEPQVVITPLARAMLRPFAAAVFPGADDRRLGASPKADGLLGDALAGELGLPTVALRRQGELLAFVHLLAVPRLTLLRRRDDLGEPLSDSPLVERLSMAIAAHGAVLGTWVDPRVDENVVPTPINMSAPSAPGRLPTELSASACEALRACPYRFFALYLLGLREDDELEREIEPRDYGNWLHAVLHDFHVSRAAPETAAAEVARLLSIAEAQRVASGLSDAEFLPFAAAFAGLAPRYIEWLHKRDAAGARWRDGEFRAEIAPAALGGIVLAGRIDRFDALRDGAAIELIDYKTSGVDGLKEKVREPLEDTQLAFYAALMRSRSEQPLRAIYLAVGSVKGVFDIEHQDVDHSAERLVEGLADEFGRLRAGAAMPALGAGATCEYCAARAVCRRDHWSDDPIANNTGAAA